ncbi:MAG: substrate-binding domain-containing protein, partial [Oscillibacter sp.]
AEDWRMAANVAKSKQIEGVILGGNAQADMVSEFQSQNISVVLVNNRMSGFDLPAVVSDEAGGVAQAVEHLIDRGHRNIGMIAGRFSPYIIGERYNAFLRILQENGLDVGDANIKMCEPNIESATRAALELLDRKDRPTAVFGSNDVIAAGVIKAAIRLRLRVPEDVAVVGYDDSILCGVTEPELTSVHVNCRRMGELCVERLQAMLDGGDGNAPQVTLVSTELHIRKST